MYKKNQLTFQEVKQQPTDLNINAPDEVGFNNGAVIQQGVSLFIQEIKFLFDTEKGEVLGSDLLHTRHGWVYHFNGGVSNPHPKAWMEHTFKGLYETK